MVCVYKQGTLWGNRVDVQARQSSLFAGVINTKIPCVGSFTTRLCTCVRLFVIKSMVTPSQKLNHGSYRQSCVKFKDFSRNFPTILKYTKLK